MPVILVVDDSHTDRVLIEQLLLQQEEMDWLVEFAESAEEAMVAITHLAVDVVVTDMLMSGLSGMDLLTHIRKQVNPVPVVMVSGHDDQVIAADAIRNGAASYVPKDQLATRLVETVKQILDIRNSSYSYQRLLGSVQDLRIRLQLESDPELIPPLVSALQKVAFDMKLISVESQTRFGVALDEAIINAMYHGNLEIPAEDLAEARTKLRDGETTELLDSRRTSKPYADRRVQVEAAISAEKIVVLIRHEGQSVDPSQGEDQRGMTLIRNIMDEVTIDESGREMRLVKHREVANDDDGLAADTEGTVELS